MQAFYFDVFDGQKVAVDDYGDDFVNVHEAAEQAKGILTDIIRERPLNSDCQDFGVAVRDDTGGDVYRAALFFRDVHLDPHRPSASQESCSVWMVKDPTEHIRRAKEIQAELQQNMQKLKENVRLSAELIREIANRRRAA